MKLDLSHHAPLGINLQREQRFFTTGIICSIFYSLIFLPRYQQAHSMLYHWKGDKCVLIPGAIIEDFGVLLENALVGFLILALCMLALIVYHYAYHYQGSKSIYLMKRLPNRWEMHRRCITLPLLAALICLIAAIAFLLIYFGIYMVFTPKECLTLGQWQKIWSVLL